MTKTSRAPRGALDVNQPTGRENPSFRPIPARVRDVTLARMRAYALAELGDRLSLHVFIRREDAFAALDDASDDEVQCPRIQFIAPIELDKLDISTN